MARHEPMHLFHVKCVDCTPLSKETRKYVVALLTELERNK